MSKPAHLVGPDALIVWAAVADRFDHGSQSRLGFKSYRPLGTPHEAANTAHLPRHSPNLDARSDCHRPNKRSTSQCAARTAPSPFVYNVGPEGTRPSSRSRLDLWFTHRKSAWITDLKRKLERGQTFRVQFQDVESQGGSARQPLDPGGPGGRGDRPPRKVEKFTPSSRTR